MRSRNLKHKIEIQNLTTTTNGYGEETESFTKFKEVRAAIENFSSKEVFFSSGIIEKSTKKFRIRFLPGVTTDMRIKQNDKYFDIVEIVNPQERNKELIIAVSECAND